MTSNSTSLSDIHIPNFTSTGKIKGASAPTSDISTSSSEQSSTSGKTLILKIEESVLAKFKRIGDVRGVSTKELTEELVSGLTRAIEQEKVKIKKVTTNKLIAGQFDNINLDNSLLQKKMFNIRVEGIPLCAASLQDYIHPDKTESDINLNAAAAGSTGNVISTLFSDDFSPPLSESDLFSSSNKPNISFNKTMARRRIELLDNGNLRLHTGNINVSSSMELSDAIPASDLSTIDINPHLVTRKIVIDNGIPSLMTIENIITKTAEASAEAALKKAKKPWFNFDFKFFSPDVKINGEEGTTTLSQDIIKFGKSVSLMTLKGLAAICLTTGILTAGLEGLHRYTDKIPGAVEVIHIIKDKIKDGPLEVGLSTEGVSIKMGSAPKEDVVSADKAPDGRSVISSKVLENEILLKTEFYSTMAHWNIKDAQSINSLKYITIAVDNIQTMHKLAGQGVFVDELDLKEAHIRLESLNNTTPKVNTDLPKNTPYTGPRY